MCCLGEESKRNSMLKHIPTLRNDFLVLLYGSVAITDAEDRQHFEKGKRLLQERLAEDVGASHKDRVAIHRAEDDQWIKQRTRMIATNNDSSIFGKVLLASNSQAAQ